MSNVQGALKNVGHRVARSTVAGWGVEPTIWTRRECNSITYTVYIVTSPRVVQTSVVKKSAAAVRLLLERSGVHVIQTPFRAPNCNAHAERFVRSIKEECLKRVIPLGEQHFRRTLAAYVVHYHQERNHQGLGNELIENGADRKRFGSIRKRQRLGGLLSYYYRAA